MSTPSIGSGDALPDASRTSAVDEWSFHHRLLYRLVLGTPGSRTAELNLLYDAVSPVAYQRTTTTPCDSRGYRRKLLNDLRDAGVVEAHDTPAGRVWVPSEDVVELVAPEQLDKAARFAETGE